MASELVVVSGHDALAYLDTQVTQDLSSLGIGDRAETLLLDPAGAVVAAAAVRRPEAHVVTVEVPAGTAEAARARLERFAIRADVAFAVTAPATSEAVLSSEVARITAGWPASAELAHRLVPHGLAPSLLDATVSFTKGCYPGQELVARMRARHATPPLVLRGLVTDAAIEPGDAVGAPERAGSVTSAARDGARVVALCVLHRRDAVPGDVEVRRGGSVLVARLVEDPSVRS